MSSGDDSSKLTVPMNHMSGTDSVGLSSLINQMEKKLDSANRRFNPQFGAHNNAGVAKEADVNQFDVDFEFEVQEQEK